MSQLGVQSIIFWVIFKQLFIWLVEFINLIMPVISQAKGHKITEKVEVSLKGVQGVVKRFNGGFGTKTILDPTYTENCWPKEPKEIS